MTPTAQYAKDSTMDNSRIIFCRHTGIPTGWTDTAGKAHPLPVDFRRVSAATCEQYRAYWLKDDPVPTDETTMNRVDVRHFFRDQNARDDAADVADENRRDFWTHLAFIVGAAVIFGAGYATCWAVVGMVVK